MADEHRATCGYCGASIPLDLLAAHLSDHGYARTAEIEREFADAPIEIIDTEDDDA